MTEYVLAGSLMLLGCLGALIALQGSLSEGFENMLSQGRYAPKVAITSAPGKGELTNPPMSDSEMTGLLSRGSFKLENGLEVLLPSLQTSTAKEVQTSGANGATQKMLADLHTLMQAMTQADMLDPQTAHDFDALINQGYRLADLERQIEHAVANARSTADFLNTPLSFNGKTISVRQAGEMVGFSDMDLNRAGGTVGERLNTNADYVLTPGGRYTGSETLAFINAYQKLIDSPAMSDPTVKATVKRLATEISFLTDVVSQELYYVTNHGDSVNQLKSGVISGTTALNSLQICETGKGQQNCV